ncbi:MAG TPA: alpha/beta fold hydrolase [Puia sp.]|nr:alpha/beta fold hydrolase [Puia sp.]
MKQYFALVFIFLSVFIPRADAQTLDTLIDVGGYKLHFSIIPGKGIPVLFEAGGGDDASAWNGIIRPIAEITHTTLITYDRIGFGKSGLDSNQHGIVKMIDGLETGLHKLGYWGNIMLVAHSQGAIYAQVFAFRHPDLVKATVMIDGTTPCFYESQRLTATQHSIDETKDKWKKSRPGMYYQSADFSANINIARNSPFPASVPVTDLVSDYPPFNDSNDILDWKRCHREFSNGAPNRLGITAFACHHYIFREAPLLVISVISKMYADASHGKETVEILQRLADYELAGINDIRKRDNDYMHSENDLNSWGYQFFSKGEIEKALSVFKLNILLNPSSWNVYDSYGEALMRNGDKKEATRMYQKSVALNPKNENGKNILEELSEQAQDFTQYKREFFIRGRDTLRYRILYPEDYKIEKSYPLLVFLHGGGERGNDNEAQLIHGAGLFLRDSLRKQFPAIVIFPQCPSDSLWTTTPPKITNAPYVVDTTAAYYLALDAQPITTPERLVKLLMDSLADHNIADKKRIYIGGLSMGGLGTYSLLIHCPNYFAAAFSICGEANKALYIKKAAGVPIWIFHGEVDNVIPVQPDRDLYKALQKMGAKNVKYTEYPGVNHGSWNRVFAEPGLFPWLFSFKK